MDREYQPISAWGYIGYRILFAIPVVGLICTIVIILAVIASLMGWSPT